MKLQFCTNCRIAAGTWIWMKLYVILHRLQKCSRHLNSFQKKLAKVAVLHACSQLRPTSTSSQMNSEAKPQHICYVLCLVSAAYIFALLRNSVRPLNRCDELEAVWPRPMLAEFWAHRHGRLYLGTCRRKQIKHGETNEETGNACIQAKEEIRRRGSQ